MKFPRTETKFFRTDFPDFRNQYTIMKFTNRKDGVSNNKNGSYVNQ